MKFTPRETQVLALFVDGKLNKQIAYDLGLSTETVKVYLRRIYRKMGARHGREAMSSIVTKVAKAGVVAGVPEGQTLATELDIVDRILQHVCVEQDNYPDAYSYEHLEIDELRREDKKEPLSEFVSYYDSLGGRPCLKEFDPEQLTKFGRYIEPFHYVMDIDLRTKDNEFSKFKYIRGGDRQPTVSPEDHRQDLTLGTHPYKPLADELATRLGLISLTHRPCYQRGQLCRNGKAWTYESVSVPLFDSLGNCIQALMVFHSAENY